MNPGSNSFQNPSVLPVESPAVADANFSAPLPVSPVGETPSSYQTVPASAFDAETGSLHPNLMDEISSQIKSTNSQTIVKVMRLLNIVLASTTVTVGVLAWMFGQVNTFQKVIAGIYIMYASERERKRAGTATRGMKLIGIVAVCRMFGVFLLAFEMRTETIDVVLRKNFGFMYGNKTRTVFLVL